jgi:hypothetical protein
VFTSELEDELWERWARGKSSRLIRAGAPQHSSCATCLACSRREHPLPSAALSGAAPLARMSARWAADQRAPLLTAMSRRRAIAGMPVHPARLNCPQGCALTATRTSWSSHLVQSCRNPPMSGAHPESTDFGTVRGSPRRVATHRAPVHRNYPPKPQCVETPYRPLSVQVELWIAPPLAVFCCRYVSLGLCSLVRARDLL